MEAAAFEPLFTHIYKGDQHAAWLSTAILKVLHTWDDLIDKDKEISDAAINNAFVSSLTDITMSPLWDANMASLLKLVYFKWQAANKIESGASHVTDNDLAKAWMLRASCYDFFILIARKLYGDAWAEEISLNVYNYYGEPLEEFIQEVRDA